MEKLTIDEVCDLVFRHEPEFREKALPVVHALYKKYGAPLDYGRNRVVFATVRSGIKFPRNGNGIVDNDW